MSFPHGIHFFFWIGLGLLHGQFVPFGFWNRNPNPVDITIANVSVSEGDSAVFTITTSANVNQNLTVNFATANGTAVSGTHYTASTGSVVIAAGTSSATVSVPTQDLPALCQSSLQFVLNLTGSSFGTITDSQGTATITETDFPTLSIAAGPSVVEGAPAIATVSLSQSCAQDVSFRVTTTNGTATAGQDYVAQTNQLYTISAGDTSRDIAITTTDDATDEDDGETLTVTLSSPANATIAVASAVLSIDDNDAPPTLVTVSPIPILEGNSGLVRVQLSAPSARTITFDYQTANGTATSGGGDYTSITATSASIPPMQTEVLLTVTTLADAVTCEGDETFTMNLTNVTNAAFSGTPTTITILDDDLPSVTSNQPTVAEGGTVTFDVEIDFACPSNAMSFDYAAVPGSATLGSDFAATTGTITFAAGTTTLTDSFTVSTIDDGHREMEEYFSVSFHNLQYVKTPQAVPLARITDNETGVHTVKVVNAGWTTCALSSDNQIKCWGMKSTMGLPEFTLGDDPSDMGANLRTTNLGSHDGLGVITHTVQSYARSDSGGVFVLDDGRVKINTGDPTYRRTGDELGYVSLTVDGLGITPHTAKKVVGQFRHYCLVLDDDRLKCWGTNFRGKSGNGNTTATTLNDDLPYIDLGTVNGAGVTRHTVKDVAMREDAICAHLEDNRLKCWGSGEFGGLLNGSTQHFGDNPGEMGDNLPYVNLGTGRTVKKIHGSCAILDNDRVKCWGFAEGGVLGSEGTAHLGDHPAEVGDNLPYVDLGTHDGLGVTPHTAKDIVMSLRTACAILDDDRLKCWGLNWFGQLGLGDTQNRGDNPGEMGDNLPYVDLGPGRKAKKVHLISDSTYVLRDNDTLVSFGRNDLGQLGLGHTNNIGDQPGEMGINLVPVDFGSLYVTGFASDSEIAIWSAELMACFILSNGKTTCFGDPGLNDADFMHLPRKSAGDEPGELGLNMPSLNLPSGKTPVDIFGGFIHSGNHSGFCVVYSDKTFSCFGRNRVSVLGSNSLLVSQMGDNLPIQTLPSGKAPIKISTSTTASCAIDEDLNLFCWGDHFSGEFVQLNGTSIRNGSVPALVPKALVGTHRKVLDFETGESACALLDDLKVKCWGRGSESLGYGDRQARGTTPETSGDNLGYVELGSEGYPIKLTSSALHRCALFNTGKVKCWGANNAGILGVGDTDPRGDNPGEMGDSLPFVDLGTGRTAKDILAFSGEGFGTCAIRDDDSVVCWGYSYGGVLGATNGSKGSVGDAPGEMGDTLIPVDLIGSIPIQIQSEGTLVCTLSTAHEVKCWGQNGRGELGQGDMITRGENASTMGANLLPVDIQW